MIRDQLFTKYTTSYCICQLDIKVDDQISLFHFIVEYLNQKH